jgi:hypothetical protein
VAADPPPQNEGESNQTHAAQGGFACIEACSQTAAVSSVRTNLGLAFSFVALDQAGARWKNGGECEKKSSDAWSEAFCHQACRNRAQAPKEKSDCKLMRRCLS